MISTLLKKPEPEKLPEKLILPDGSECGSIEQLRTAYTDSWALTVLEDGSMLGWLLMMYYEEEADAVEQIFEQYKAEAIDGEKAVQKLRAIFKLPHTEKQNEIENKLKAYTDDPELLEKAENAVYSQKELAEKLRSGCRDILLVDGSFNIPMSAQNVTYTAVGDPSITSPDRADLATSHIRIIGAKLDSDTENSETLAQLIEAFSVPKYWRFVVLEKKIEDFKRFDSKYECCQYIRDKMGRLYDEAARYLNTAESRCISRETARYYSDTLEKAYQENLAVITKLCSDDKKPLIEDLQECCNCYKKLLTAFDEELNDSDFYSLYKRSYFEELPEVEEESCYENGVILKGCIFEKKRYYTRECYKAKSDLQKDLNDLVQSFFGFAEKAYNSSVGNQVIGLLKKICG